MKILEVNGYKYSLGHFDEYKFRAKVRFGRVSDEPVTVDIYTTDPDKQSVENFLLDRRTEKVTSIQITYWCTREDDDAASEMVNEWLNEEDNS